MISDAELDAHIRQKTADANLDEDTADRYGEIADQIAKENP
ncbi:hypothetical protein [Streptacidiphilus sp. EB129]